MINVVVPSTKYVTEEWDEEQQDYVIMIHELPPITLYLEHSLIALSKWEARYKVPFLKSIEYLSRPEHFDKFLYYVNCMSTKGEIAQDTLKRLTSVEMEQITKYISDPHSATIVSMYGASAGKGKSKNTITSEYLYAMMSQYRISETSERWHLANLLARINICADFNTDPKKKKKGLGDTELYYAQNERLIAEGKPV